MPVRRLEKKPERPLPYKPHKPSTMAAVLSPHPHVPSWPSLNARSPLPAWQPQLAQYQSHAPLSEYSTTLPAPIVTGQLLQNTVTNEQISHSRRPSASQGPGAIGTPQDGPWTAEMDAILMQAQSQGLRWEQIAQVYFPRKSANACRKRFGRAKEERRATDWNESRIQRVMAAYNQSGMRERMWGHVSRETGEKWQDVERWCFGQGLLKMTRSQTAHSRHRSRSSRLSASHSMDENRYPSPSNDDYDANDQHAVGLGVSSHSYHPNSVVQPSVSVRPTIETMLHPNHRYSYAS